jgi:hypothetical protein
VINIVYMNYLIGHNPQVISQLSRGGLNIMTSEEIARRWAQYQRSITQLNHESLLQFCAISHYHSCQETGRKGYFIYTVTVLSYKCQ